MGKNMLSLKNPLHYGLIGMLFLVLMASPFVMMSNDFTITPSNPVVGDSVTIKGTAVPNSQVTVQVLYEQSLPVHNGAYQLALKGIFVPTPSNSITIKTTNVQSMSVGLKQRMWITLTSKVVNGVSTLTQNNIGPGTYDATIYGKSEASSVQLSVTSSETLTADSKGNYLFVYNSSGMPKGKYTVKVGSVSKSFILK
jgi:hypothetical protein